MRTRERINESADLQRPKATAHTGYGIPKVRLLSHCGNYSNSACACQGRFGNGEGDEELEQKLSKMVKAGIFESCYTQAAKGEKGKAAYRIRSGGAKTDRGDSDDGATTLIIPEKNDRSVSVIGVIDGEMPICEPDSVGQRQNSTLCRLSRKRGVCFWLPQFGIITVLRFFQY